MTRGLFFLALVASVAAVAAPAQAAKPATTPLERVSALVQPSIVYLESTFTARVYDNFNHGFVRDAAFEVGYRCSGFFVNPAGYIATAGHCVETDDSVKDDIKITAAHWALANGYYKGRPSVASAAGDYSLRELDKSISVAYGVAASGLPTGRSLPAQLIGLRSFQPYAGDVALLKINGEDLPALSLAPNSQVDVGERVVSVGYPASVDLVTDETFDPSFKDGSISSKKTRGPLPVYEISTAVSGGMSGGPTVNLQGDVIGVNSFGIVGEPQAFNFVSPASALTDLLRDKGVQNQIGSVNATYRAGLQAYWKGDRAEALAKLDEVLGIVPSHQLAQAFRAKAERLPKSKSGGVPWIWLAVGIGAALLILLGGVLALRRRQKPIGSNAASQQAAAPGPPPRAAIPAKTTLRDPRAGGSGGAVLTVTNGELAGRRFPIATETTLGREGVDVVFEDTDISRRHALVRPAGRGLEIVDLQSANGTYVNGARIDGPTQLQNGDIVELGGTKIGVEISDVPTTVAGGGPRGRSGGDQAS